jgi:hypothetical protein
VTDVGFIVAGYGVILGGLAIYAVTLQRRLRAARDAARRGETAQPDAERRHDEAS